MSKFLMLLGVLVLSAAWLMAQTPSSTSPSSSQSSTSSSQTGTSGQSDTTGSQSSMGSESSGSAESVEGCLSGSAGSYTLTSDSGTTYQLSGDTSKLADHVGHEVQIKGTTSGSSGASSSGSSSSSMGAGSSGGSQTLTVESVKHVSKTCKSGSTSK